MATTCTTCGGEGRLLDTEGFLGPRLIRCGACWGTGEAPPPRRDEQGWPEELRLITDLGGESGGA